MIMIMIMMMIMRMMGGQVGDHGLFAGVDVHDPWSDTCVGGRGSGCPVFFLLEFTGRVDGSKRITADFRLHRRIRPFNSINSMSKSR